MKAIQTFEKELLEMLNTRHADMMGKIREKREITSDVEEKLKEVISGFVSSKKF